MHSYEIDEFIWPPGIADKVLAKHDLFPEDVEDSFFHPEGKVRRHGDRLLLLSRTDNGAFIIVVWAYARRVATIISARTMTRTERRQYERK